MTTFIQEKRNKFEVNKDKKINSLEGILTNWINLSKEKWERRFLFFNYKSIN